MDCYATDNISNLEKTMKMIHQKFNWHDATGKCKFFYGKNKNLEIDGSGVGISCSRYINHPITSSSDLIELNLSVVIGKSYGIGLCDENLVPVVDIVINEQGWVLNWQGNEYVNTGLFLTRLGNPVVDPEFYCHYWYPEWTDQTIFRFSDISLSDKTFTLTLVRPSNELVPCDDGLVCLNSSQDQIRLPMNLQSVNQQITKVNLYSPSDLAGTMIRLKSYKQINDNKIVDHETFPVYWEPIHPNLDGYPSDNICESITRPMKNE
jgi:hypothetical protein